MKPGHLRVIRAIIADLESTYVNWGIVSDGMNPAVKHLRIAEEALRVFYQRRAAAFSGDGVVGASYGETKLECSQIGYTMDRIVEAIEAGEIPVWATRQSEIDRNARIVRESIADGTYCTACKVPWSDCDCEDGSPVIDQSGEY